MCGGFVLAYSSAKISSNDGKLTQLIYHLFYNLGRVSSYVALGAIFGFLGEEVSFSKVASGYVYFVVGILMVLMGLSLMGKIRFLTLLESSFTLHPRTRRIFSSLLQSKSKLSFYLLGMLNGFIPCGLVYFFLISALASGSVLGGMLVMFIFGVSTMPSLISFGFISSFLQSSHWRGIMTKIASFVIIFYGIYLSFLGFLATKS